MRRASHEHTPSVGTTLSTPSAQFVKNVSPSVRDSRSARSAPHSAASTEVLLLPNGTFVSERGDDDSGTQRRQQLAIAIRQRIESRLAGRIRNLAVRIVDRTIFLEGECFTYYTKQLAQHAALGILDDEQLENSIVVVVPR